MGVLPLPRAGAPMLMLAERALQPEVLGTFNTQNIANTAPRPPNSPAVEREQAFMGRCQKSKEEEGVVPLSPPRLL